MKKVLAMLGLALTILISTPALHAATTDSGTVTAPVIIRDVTTPVDYGTVIIRDIALSPTHAVIIRNLATNFSPDWTVIIRDIASAHPGWNIIIRDITPNTVIIRDLSPASSSTNAQPFATVIIR